MSTTSLTREQSRRVDATAIERFGFPGIVLMENAGRGCADVIERLDLKGPVLIACGSGNNAGDGFVIARHLHMRGHTCRVVLASDPARLNGDALTAYQMMKPCRVNSWELYELDENDVRPALDRFSGRCELLVDALLGTGATGNPRPPYDTVIRWMNDQPATRLAVDLPSGLDCDTGQPGEPTFHADHTCTFHAPKIGFTKPSAAEFVGQMHVVGIGIPGVDA